MSYKCEFCGKGVSFGRQYTYRGLAKSKGGNGVKITGKSRKKYRPNVQRVRAVVNGATVRVKVCTQCIRAGKVVKPPKMKHVLQQLSETGKIKPKTKAS